jgi:serine/threonine protein kinase
VANYRNSTRIGSGGFGEVWRCERDSDGARFAKKMLLPGCAAMAKSRFQKEVRILAKLDHPNIIPVVARHLETDPLWYAMPLYDRSLDDELPHIQNDGERIPVIFGAILDAVEYAHSEGVIHRDLKLANVLMNNDDDVVVTDFGLGRVIDAESTRLTSTGDRMGTIFYMAPEQLRDSKSSDARSDVFSLGRILYELYTGQLTSAVQDTTSVDPAIALIIDRCTRSDPEKRFQSVSELKNAWNAAVRARDSSTDYEQLKKISARLAATRHPDVGDVLEVLEILGRYGDDTDLLHDTLMQLPPRAVAIMVSENRARARDLISRFVQHVTGQAWGFSYTDSIGRQCSALFEYIDDPQIRADLLYCVVEVGVSHNRWFVVRIAQELFEKAHNSAESLAIVERFSTAGRSFVDWIKEHVGTSRLNPIILDWLKREARR